MLCFRVFVRIHSLRSLDSFIDLNPILCPRFLNSFPCHTSKKTLLNPVLATLRKNSKITPFFATHPTPRGPSHFGSTHLPSSSGAGGTPSSSAHSPISPYPLSSFFSHSCALFCIFLHFFAFAKNSTLLFPIDSALFAKNTRAGGTRLFKRPNTANCERLEGTLFHGSPDTGRRTRVTSHCHPRRRSVIIRKKLRTNNS